MLGLLQPTNAAWIHAANNDLTSLLIDHAHCEKKAAATALSLINRYPENTELVRRLIAMAQEELEHFARILQVLTARGIALTHDRGDTYARRLHELCRKQEPGRFLDSLLIAALIEARSCERFTLLSTDCIDDELRGVYRDLLASEAGHYSLFTELARNAFPTDDVRQRLHELTLAESDIIRSLGNAPLMHG